VTHASVTASWTDDTLHGPRFGQPITFTATVVGQTSDSATPKGAVQFVVDGVNLGAPVPLDDTGHASITRDDLSVSTCSLVGCFGHGVRAQYIPAAPGPGSVLEGYGPSSANFPNIAGLFVSPAPLSITASSPTVTVGDAAPAIAPTYAGFVHSDTPASLTTAPVCTTEYRRGDPVGTYPTTCAGASDPNYDITNLAGVLTVESAAESTTTSTSTSTSSTTTTSTSSTTTTSVERTTTSTTTAASSSTTVRVEGSTSTVGPAAEPPGDTTATVAPSSDRGNGFLPFTGDSSRGTLVLAVLLLTLGAFLSGGRRRRREQR
jgi:hypothetical protein